MVARDFGPSELERLVAEQVLPDSNAVAPLFKLIPNPEPASFARREQAMADLNFGVAFTDYMASARWSADRGWYERHVEPFAPLALSPASAVLHYAQEIFEGMKVFAWADGSLQTFRPGFNSARLNLSAERMAMPPLPLDDFLGSLAQLVRADSAWVPTKPGSALYLRPFMIADEAFLGVRPAERYRYMVIASPVGPYFSSGDGAVSIWVSSAHHRAAPGGTGAAKTGGNYAASLQPQILARQKGFDQVCYLDARSATLIEELGGMNVFVVKSDGSVLTPRLSGTLLEGSTRSAILQLLADRGVDVRQADIRLDWLVKAVESGEVTEMFACGTAAAITPIGRLAGDGFDLTLPGRKLAESLLAELSGIQRGTVPDRHGWMYKLN